MSRILVIDDEPAILRAITIALESLDYVVDVAATGKQAIAKVSSGEYAVIILDLGLPDMNGLDVIRQVRILSSTIPIIVLSAWQEIETRVNALDLGADDYLAKPFGMPELLARIRVALRHARTNSSVDLVDEELHFGSLSIFAAQRKVVVNQQPVELTRTQYDTLLFLARHPNRVLTHRAITNAVWGPDVDVDPQNLRVVISQIRKRIEEDPSSPQIICTELSVGYRFCVNQD